LAEELNTKMVQEGAVLALDLEITPELRREGLMREVIRHIQNARKKAGLNVDNRILLGLETTDQELEKAISEHNDTIAKETLAEAVTSATYAYDITVKIERSELRISLERAN